MNKLTLLALSLALASLGAALVTMPALAQSDLAPYRDKNRLLLVFAPSKTDPRWEKQNALLAASAAAFAERDLRRFDYLEHGGPNSAGLRARYGVKPGQFQVILVGKDGHAAWRSPAPASVDSLTGRIDQMPMRREEIKRDETKRQKHG